MAFPRECRKSLYHTETVFGFCSLPFAPQLVLVLRCDPARRSGLIHRPRLALTANIRAVMAAFFCQLLLADLKGLYGIDGRWKSSGAPGWVQLMVPCGAARHPPQSGDIIQLVAFKEFASPLLIAMLRKTNTDVFLRQRSSMDEDMMRLSYAETVLARWHLDKAYQYCLLV